MAKKADKAAKGLAKELKKLRKENEKLAEALEKVREDQARSRQEILALLEERLPARDAAADPTGDPHDENGGFVTAEPAEDAQDPGDSAEGADEDAGEEAETEKEAEEPEEPEATDAARRRAEELGVDLSEVKGTGSGGRIIVKDVEAAAESG